ncbi:MAG: hypothetical protein QXW97_00745 [Candidatus Pacearchaeota archaeon]
MNRLRLFNKICKEIDSLKIQGASNIAKKAFFAYKLIPKKSTIKKLLLIRPTEPMLKNIFKKYKNLSYKDLIKKLEKNQEIINRNVYSLIKNNYIIFTHCHSSTLTKALIYSKKNGKNFQVYNTETRPLFQGRKTSKELKKAEIPVTMFIDSAFLSAILKNKIDLILLGADAITKEGIINKIGSGMYAEISKLHKIPLYIVSDSLKFSKERIKIENRNPKEIWNEKSIKIYNPAFEFIPKKYISGIISEFGILDFKKFIKKANEMYDKV